jgi:hypothetical protein
MPENIEKVQLPGVDCAILWGFEQIGLWLGISGGQARSRANAGLIPVHRPRGRNVVFAIKSEVNAHLRDLASKSLARGANSEGRGYRPVSTLSGLG